MKRRKLRAMTLCIATFLTALPLYTVNAQTAAKEAVDSVVNSQTDSKAANNQTQKQDEPMAVALESNSAKQTYKSGSVAKVSMMVTRPGYIYLLYKNTSGNIGLLYPTNANPNNKVDSSGNLKLPLKTTIPVQISNTGGKDDIMLILSRAPIASLDKLVAKQADYVPVSQKFWNYFCKGGKFVAVDNQPQRYSVNSKWASTIMELTVNGPIPEQNLDVAQSQPRARQQAQQAGPRQAQQQVQQQQVQQVQQKVVRNQVQRVEHVNTVEHVTVIEEHPRPLIEPLLYIGLSFIPRPCWIVGYNPWFQPYVPVPVPPPMPPLPPPPPGPGPGPDPWGPEPPGPEPGPGPHDPDLADMDNPFADGKISEEDMPDPGDLKDDDQIADMTNPFADDPETDPEADDPIDDDIPDPGADDPADVDAPDADMPNPGADDSADADLPDADMPNPGADDSADADLPDADMPNPGADDSADADLPDADMPNPGADDSADADLPDADMPNPGADGSDEADLPDSAGPADDGGADYDAGGGADFDAGGADFGGDFGGDIGGGIDFGGDFGGDLDF